MDSDIETSSLIRAIAARFYAIEAAINTGNTRAALEVIKRCKSVLPAPQQHNLDAAMSELRLSK